MKHVSILALNDCVLASIVDPRTMLLGVNDFLEAAGKEPMFDVHMVGLQKEVKLHGGMFTVHADVLLDDVKKTDSLIDFMDAGLNQKELASNQKPARVDDVQKLLQDVPMDELKDFNDQSKDIEDVMMTN